jgi:hypothetical protein
MLHLHVDDANVIVERVAAGEFAYARDDAREKFVRCERGVAIDGFRK